MLNLAAIRRSRHLSQATLAKKAGVSRSFISDLEQGNYIPSIRTICKLCKALNCTPNDLINCGEDNDETNNDG